jgi:beta-phosphoglucomutase-like phosphatase (HAD superfamily)
VPGPVSTVLFDVGGVLVSDYWEALLLTPGRGLADRLGLERSVVEPAGRELWERYARRDASERDYWLDLADRIGVRIVLRDVEEVEREVIRVNPRADEVVPSLLRAGVRVGVVSNNTSFWYPKQMRLTAVSRLIDPAVEFLSFRTGRTKGERPGLLELAADAVEPGRTLVLDDRPHHVERAGELGFQTLRWTLDGGPPLPL